MDYLGFSWIFPLVCYNLGEHNILVLRLFCSVYLSLGSMFWRGRIQTNSDELDELRRTKGLICCNSVEHITLAYRRVLSGQLSIIGGLFYRVLLNRHSEDVFQGFDLLLFGRAQHIGLSTCFVWTVINYLRSILQSVVESAFRRRFPRV